MDSWLRGKRVLITRPRAQAEETAHLFEAAGAVAVIAPSIEIRPPSNVELFRQTVREHGTFDWLVFSSANGASAFIAERGESGAPAALAAQVAAVGPSTAKVLEKSGIEVALVAKEFIADSLARELNGVLSSLGRKARVLLVQAEVARDVLASELAAAGHDVTALAAYATYGAEEGEEGATALLTLFEQGVDVATFASPSAVRSVAARLGDRTAAILAQCTVASIGPVTTDAARQLGIRVDVTADPHSFPGLIQALETWGRDR